VKGRVVERTGKRAGWERLELKAGTIAIIFYKNFIYLVVV